MLYQDIKIVINAPVLEEMGYTQAPEVLWKGFDYITTFWRLEFFSACLQSDHIIYCPYWNTCENQGGGGVVIRHYAMTTEKNQDCLVQTKTATLVRGNNRQSKWCSHTELISNVWYLAQNIFPLYQSFLTSIFHVIPWQKLFRGKCR